MMTFLSSLFIFVISFIVVTCVTAFIGVLMATQQDTEKQLAMAWQLSCFISAIFLTCTIMIWIRM